MTDPDAWKAEVLHALADLSSRPPSAPDDAWRLVLAIGEARPSRASAHDVEVALQRAEAHLARYRDDVERAVSSGLRVEPLLADWAASLQQGHPEAALDQLLALEEILVGAEVLGLSAPLQRILTEVARLVAPAPAALAGLDLLARDRLALRGPSARALWDTVSEAATRVSRSAPPGVVTTWFSRLDRLRADLARGASRLTERFDVEPPDLTPVIALGRASSEWQVRVEGHCPAGWRLRLFLVDAAHPQGVPLREGVDANFHRVADRWILDGWLLDNAEDIALLIVLAAPTLPEGESLDALLVSAAASPEVRVAEVLLNPASG
ncbi:hypothetical protein [Archangium primigenium]|uniref:hypothetical protein n=1 Tax=[Archangium] primigenium TaxID=2792470 RepID=UPI001959C331|nr:hypothetical protein [Archangium primigenium]MBM7112680.1 hypothetical protein [Archangium primigenium]